MCWGFSPKKMRLQTRGSQFHLASSVLKNPLSRLMSTLATSPSQSMDTEAAAPVPESEKNGNTSVIREGEAELFQPASVFYNSAQEFNRDLSVLVLDTFLKHELWARAKFGAKAKERNNRILDALSATGLRSIRYAKELKNIGVVDKIIANDLSEKAAEIIQRNVKHNQVQEKIEVVHEDAALLMYMNRCYDNRFLAVDLDPFGSPAPFLDASVQCITDGGLLMVTCTDMAVLCGNSNETCYAKYGAISLRSEFCHEMALRIILRCLQANSNRYGRYIVPLLSVSVDFYIRLFVQVFSSAAMAKFSASKTSLVYFCNGCKSFELQPMGRIEEKQSKSNNIANNYKFLPGMGPVVDNKCRHCNHRFNVGGPIWSGSLHSFDFVEMLKTELSESSETRFGTSQRLRGMLQVISEEVDVPLYYNVDFLSRIVHCATPSMSIVRSAILNAGYLVSYSHASKLSVKTNAPPDFIWDIFRVWSQNNLSKPIDSYHDSDPGKNILKRSPKNPISFEIHKDCEPLSKELQMLRFQRNPEKYWGPKAKPAGDAEEYEKRKANESKRKKLILPEDIPEKLKCKKFKEGECDMGENCLYSHEIDDE